MKDGKIDFDVALTVPRCVPKLAPVARVFAISLIYRRFWVQRS